MYPGFSSFYPDFLLLYPGFSSFLPGFNSFVPRIFFFCTRIFFFCTPDFLFFYPDFLLLYPGYSSFVPRIFTSFWKEDIQEYAVKLTAVKNNLGTKYLDHFVSSVLDVFNLATPFHQFICHAVINLIAMTSPTPSLL